MNVKSPTLVKQRISFLDGHAELCASNIESRVYMRDSVNRQTQSVRLMHLVSTYHTRSSKIITSQQRTRSTPEHQNPIDQQSLLAPVFPPRFPTWRFV